MENEDKWKQDKLKSYTYRKIYIENVCIHIEKIEFDSGHIQKINLYIKKTHIKSRYILKERKNT